MTILLESPNSIHNSPDTHPSCGVVGGDGLPGSTHTCRDTHRTTGAAGSLSGDTQARNDTRSNGSHGACGGPDSAQTPVESQGICGTVKTSDPVDLSEYLVLRVWAETYHDTQQARIAFQNRVLRAPVFPDLFQEELTSALDKEHHLGLMLARQFRRTVPPGVREWQKSSVGIGEHLLARLVGHLGHPRIATPAHWEGAGSNRHLVRDEPFERRVSDLWQYCGHGRSGRPQKGMSADELAALGDPSLKMLVRLLAGSSVKEPGRRVADLLAVRPNASPCPTQFPVEQPPFPVVPNAHRDPGCVADSGGLSSTVSTPSELAPNVSLALWPYRRIYEARRLATVGRIHAEPCVRCGPSGKPAMPGSKWSDGHAHSDALRIVGKDILRDRKSVV